MTCFLQVKDLNREASVSPKPEWTHQMKSPQKRFGEEGQRPHSVKLLTVELSVSLRLHSTDGFWAIVLAQQKSKSDPFVHPRLLTICPPSRHWCSLVRWKGLSVAQKKSQHAVDRQQRATVWGLLYSRRDDRLALLQSVCVCVHARVFTLWGLKDKSSAAEVTQPFFSPPSFVLPAPFLHHYWALLCVFQGFSSITVQ